MEPICMVADCTDCTKMTLEEDIARLRSLQTRQPDALNSRLPTADLEQEDPRLLNRRAKNMESQNVSSFSPNPGQGFRNSCPLPPDESSHQKRDTTNDRGGTGICQTTDAANFFGSVKMREKNWRTRGESSSGKLGNEKEFHTSNRGKLNLGDHSSAALLKASGKAVSSSSDEEGIVCGCVENRAYNAPVQRTMSLYEPYHIRDLHNANNGSIPEAERFDNTENSNSNVSCRRTRSMYGMKVPKSNGFQDGLFCDVIDLYLAKSQATCGRQIHASLNKNRYSLGDMPWLNEEDMKDGFLNKRPQSRDNNGPLANNTPSLHGNIIIDNSFIQRMRENLHQFDRNNQRNKNRNENSVLDNVNQDQNAYGERNSLQKRDNRNVVQNDRNRLLLHQS